MMKRTFSKDAEYVGTPAHAIKMFCKRYPEATEGFKETFEWMAENCVNHFDDRLMADGTVNDCWCYSLELEWLDECEGKDRYYISLIMRDAA